MSSLWSRVARSEHARHFLIIAAVSIAYESIFIRHWMNVVDEGLTLYPAMRLHRGGTLYDDVAFVFPPGHLLVAWISYGLDPPGVVLSRILYAAFNLALCLVLYPLARRFMPARWALLGTLLVALAAPYSHRAHLLFGYRYLVFSALALMAFAERLRTGNPRWMFAAGVCIGVAVAFRIDPPFAAAAGIGLGLLASARDPRLLGRDVAYSLAGGVLIVAPLLAYFASTVGLETLWRETVVRPLVMTERQSLPVPDLAWPAGWNREWIHDSFVAFLFRAVGVVYAGTLAWLLWQWARARRARRPFEHALLLAFVAYGAIFAIRSLGRSDEPHLSSAIPPFCVVLAFLAWRGVERLSRARPEPARRRIALAVWWSLLAIWIFVPGADRALYPNFRGNTPFAPLEGRVLLHEDDWWHGLTPRLAEIRARTGPEDRILDLSASPLLYVLLDRMGPGYHDIVMPGTFLDEAEEQAFRERLERDPPALAILPAQPFDKLKSRSLARLVPHLMAWVASHYQVVGDPEDFLILALRPPRGFGSAAGSGVPGAPVPAPAPPPLLPLDPEVAFDAQALELGREIDEYQVTDLFLRLNGLETRLRWFDGEGVYHFPPTTIAIGRNLRDVEWDEASLTNMSEPIRVVLAHHQAHNMQSRIYTPESLAHPDNRRLVEAQADVITGITLAQNWIFEVAQRTGGVARFSPSELGKAVVRGIALARKLGAPSGFEHPRVWDRERLRLLQEGRDGGVFYTRVWTCLTNIGDADGREMYELSKEWLEEGPRKNPNLPRVDVQTCQAEDVFDWSLAAARRVLAALESEEGAGAPEGPESGAAPEVPE
jgi:phage shock protein PspC (stress-responsive transcriptional regulator)